MGKGKTMRLRLIALSAGLVGLLAGGAQAQEACSPKNLTKSGTVEAHMTTVGFLVSVRWGDGIVTLNNGETHKFRAVGGKVLETGIGETHVTGEVYNLNSIEDLNGVYYGSASQTALIEGLEGGIVIKNSSNCVYIHGKSSVEGIKLSPPAPGGVEVKVLD